MSTCQYLILTSINFLVCVQSIYLSGTAPDEWEEKYSEKHKRKFWKNIKTGAVEWKEPVKPTIAAVDVASGGGGKTSESSAAEENKG